MISINARDAMRLAAAAMLTVMCGAQAPAQQAQGAAPVTETHQYGSWVMRCYRVQSNVCDVSQSVLMPGRKVRELGISIVYVPSHNEFVGQFIVPLGVSFAKGMAITAGDYTRSNLKYRRCEREGCFVEGGLPEALINAMSQQSDAGGSVQVEAVDGKKYTFPFKLDGFQEGIAMVKQLDTQRGAAPAN
jgi:invasion protein IalB